MQQLGLWEEPPTPIAHHHIEVHYGSGARFVYCTADGKPHYRKDSYYAGFVGGALTAEECSICNPVDPLVMVGPYHDCDMAGDEVGALYQERF